MSRTSPSPLTAPARVVGYSHEAPERLAMQRAGPAPGSPSDGTGMSVMFARAAMAPCQLSGFGAADAAAATGDLLQTPGASGCLSVIGFCSSGRALDGPDSATVSPDGQSGYVASFDSDALAVFDPEPIPPPAETTRLFRLHFSLDDPSLGA